LKCFHSVRISIKKVSKMALKIHVKSVTDPKNVVDSPVSLHIFTEMVLF